MTGLPTTADDLRQAGARITNVKKLFNIRQGWTRADDTLPPRVLDSDGDGPPTRLSRPWLETMIAAYYDVRGWEEDGSISPAHLERIGLGALVASEVGPARP